jgi:hypothetical protein
MYFSNRSPREEYQRVIERKRRDVVRWISEKCDGTERYNLAVTNDGIGLRVAFQSIRAKELLSRLHKEVFSPGFEMVGLTLNEQGVWSAWFGYSEPLPSPHYVFA